jgi:hypothetical protein
MLAHPSPPDLKVRDLFQIAPSTREGSWAIDAVDLFQIAPDKGSE